MIKHIDIPTQPCHSGVTLTEYAILIALIGVLGLAGLSSLGGNTSGLLKNSSKDMAANNTLSLLAPSKQSGSNLGAQDQDEQGALTQRYYKMVIESETGAPMLQVVNTASGTGTNVSSADGLQKSSIEVASAAKIAELANKETDPVAQNYYRKLAELTYWLGGTQGVLDNVKPLVDYANKKTGAKIYTKKNALTDLINYERKLQEMLLAPPAEVTAEDLELVRPVIENALMMAQSYLDKYNNLISTDVNGNDYVRADVTGDLLLANEPIIIKGNNLTPAQKEKARQRIKTRQERLQRKATDRSYGTFAKLPEMEKVAAKVVNNKSVASTSVKDTLKTGAVLVEKAAPVSATEAKTSTTQTK